MVVKYKRKSISKKRPATWQLDWNAIVVRAKEIVESYDTGVTLRQLYYRLVSEGLIPNKQNAYKQLSSKTAAARREGWFPDLIDRTREIERFQTFESPDEALEWLTQIYRRERTEGQDWSIYVGVEKHGLTTQLVHWFGKYGIPVLALGGYSSQTFVDVVRDDVVAQGRKSVLLYAGDFDPSGMDIPRDFTDRTDIFDKVVRVALSRSQIEEYDLPPMPGKEADSRSGKFILEHGELIQVELDAIPPDKLRELYQAEIDKHFDEKAWKKSVKREDTEQERLMLAKERMESTPPQIALNFIKDADTHDDDVRERLEEMHSTVRKVLGYPPPRRKRRS